jgi:uncharacterized protein (TIGR03382 family)
MALRALRAAVLALLPSLALAQTTVTVVPTEVGRADCTAGTKTVTLTWTYAAATSGDSYRLAAQTSCGTAPAKQGANTIGDDVGVTGTGGTSQSQSVTVSVIGTAYSANCTSNSDTPIKICIYYIPKSGGSTPTAASGDFNFQTAVPPAPVNVSASPANKAIDVSFGAATPADPYNANTSKYAVEYKDQLSSTWIRFGTTSNTTIRITGLTNTTVTYDVRVIPISSAGNEGPPSATVSATPQPFDDFWTRYKNAGGQEEGGCGAGGAGALAPLILALAVFLRRRG